jgi:hypothetical protein
MYENILEATKGYTKSVALASPPIYGILLEATHGYTKSVALA